MTDRPLLRVIAYDVASDKRRRKLADALEDAAVRVQESVFEARLTDRQVERLMARLQRLTGAGDSLRLYTVPDGALDKCRTEGGPAISGGARYWLL